MKAWTRFALWLAALYGGLVALIAAVAALVAAGLEPETQVVLARVLEERATLLGFIALILFFACSGIVHWLLARFVTAPGALAEQTRIVASANPAHRVCAAGGPELAELAAAINVLGDAYRSRHVDTEARIAESSARLEEERNRLAALMSELSQGVLLCNAEGRILLYNEQARSLFGTAGTPAPSAPQSPVGLGRSVFSFLDRDQVAHALDKIQYGLDRDCGSPVTKFLTTSPAKGLVKVQLAPFLASDGRIAGMVLTLEDVTEAAGQEAERRALLQALATRVRQPAANIRAAAENLVGYPEMEEPVRVRFAEIIAAESRGLSATIDEALRAHAEALTAGLSLEDMRVVDLLGVVRRRIDALPGLSSVQAEVDPGLWVKVDSYAFAQALASLAERLRDERSVLEMRLRAAARGGFVELDLAWNGASLASDALPRWEGLPIAIGTEQSSLTIRNVLERHGGEVWHQSDARSQTSWFRFLLPLAEPVVARTRRRFAADSRPEYYDFDLFGNANAAGELAEQRLADLSYTAFDTETTGLEPSAGDKIISIGAVRIVNGRVLKHEVYEQLVNPNRSVPRDSVRIHGINPGDLQNQPSIAEVLPAFHRFCEDTVLVAHNAAFDMRFLELCEPETGIRFSQPVLDTLLLSAVVHRSHRDHQLEAIAQRLGIPVIGRHTAVGDALVTGEAFLKLIPLLAELGIHTLGEALAASRETFHARVQY
jgi:DNA polymerase-3 subunit epsilon